MLYRKNMILLIRLNREFCLQITVLYFQEVSSITQKLTQKQQRFVDEYIISGNATQAAIKAGYSKKTAKQMGTENLAKPIVKTAIEKRNEEIKSEKTADMTEVMEYLTSVMRGEQTESVATAKGVYEDVEVSAKDRIKAAELIGKRHGAWTDKKVISGDVQIDVGMGDYDDEQKEGDTMPNIKLNFPKPYNVFNKQIFDNLFDYSHFVEVWY